MVIRYALSVVLMLVLTGPSRAEEGTKVTIENFTFNPAVLTVKAGTAVTFENADDIPHSVVSKGGEFHSKALDTGESFTMVFKTAGDADYFCGLHPHMVGKISVQR